MQSEPSPMQAPILAKRVLPALPVGIWIAIAGFAHVRLQAADMNLADLAEHRLFDEMCEFLNEQPDVNETQADGMSALHWASYHDAHEAAAALLRAGALVNVENRYGVRPISLACQNGNGALVELMLNSGADPNSELPGGETALMTASRTGKLRPVSSLIAHGANVNAKERRNQTALMWAAAEGNHRVVHALIEAGAEIDHQLASGFTALFFAIREGRSQATEVLLFSGCDVNQVIKTSERPRFGFGRLRLTPLLLAIENGHFELATELLAAGADPNAAPSGYTALHSMVWVRKPIRGDGAPPPIGSGSIDSLAMVEALVQAGADVNARYKGGKSELGRFTYQGSTPFLLASQASDVPLMKRLLRLGADIEITNMDGTTPLLAATGIDAIGDGDESAGIEEEAILAAELLLDNGLDINAVDQNGETVMHGAAYQSRANLVRLLASRGADIDVWNRENRAGWTPHMIATGYRPGNFRLAPATLEAVENVMRNKGAPIPDKSTYATHQRTWNSAKNKDHPWILRGLEYARVGEQSLQLDLYLPTNPSQSILVVWVHGGAWRRGTRTQMPLRGLVEAGYSIASVDYRLATTAQFPAQVHDIKAAIRYLRFLADRYGYRKDRIAIAGSSAGGHLAALVGTTNQNSELEGNIGEHLDQSSAVQAIVDLFGPTNLTTILNQSTPQGLRVRQPALLALLGAMPEETPEMACLASPVEHVDAMDPPLLILHGDQDIQVPISQSHELQEQYTRLGLPVRMSVLHGQGHGGRAFFKEETLALIDSFLGQLQDDSQ